MAAFVQGCRMPARHRREGAHGGRRPKSLEGGNRGGVRTGGGVGLWGFSVGACGYVWVEGRRLSTHRGAGFGRRAQDRNGALVVSNLRFGGRKQW